MINTADIKTGFWIATGALIALFLFGLVTGGLAKLGRG